MQSSHFPEAPLVLKKANPKQTKKLFFHCSKRFFFPFWVEKLLWNSKIHFPSDKPKPFCPKVSLQFWTEAEAQIEKCEKPPKKTPPGTTSPGGSGSPGIPVQLPHTLPGRNFSLSLDQQSPWTAKIMESRPALAAFTTVPANPNPRILPRLFQPHLLLLFLSREVEASSFSPGWDIDKCTDSFPISAGHIFIFFSPVNCVAT